MIEQVINGEVRSSSIKVLKRIVGGKAWLKPDCRFCDLSAVGHVSLKDHCDAAHDSTTPYACHFCLVEFATLAAFSSHVMLEEMNRSSMGVFKCPECKDDFHLPTLLSKHFENVHSDVRVPPEEERHRLPFFCHECNKGFREYEKFVEHRRKPSDLHVQRPSLKRAEFKCRDCKAHLANETDFQQHYLKDHGNDNPFGCSRCGKMFPTVEALRKHFVTVEFNRRHVCLRCGVSER